MFYTLIKRRFLTNQSVKGPIYVIIPDKTFLVSILYIKNTDKAACFSCMQISLPHNLNLCSDSKDTRFFRTVFEAVQKTCSTCFIGAKTTRLRLVVLNPIKHS